MGWGSETFLSGASGRPEKGPVIADVRVVPAPVIVAVEPQPPRSELGETLVAACSAALSPRTCILRESSDAPADATVTWESADAVRVRARSRGGREPASERTLRFRPADREPDRWNAAGLVVAALAHEVSEPEAVRPSSPSPPSRPRPRPARAWVGVGGLVGSGLSSGPARVGGFIRPAIRLSELPVFVSVGFEASQAGRGPEGIRPSWFDASLGLGVAFALEAARSEIRLRLDGVVEDQRLTRQGVSGSRLMDGLVVSGEAAWPSGFPVAAVAGLRTEVLAGATAARVEGKKVASFPARSTAAFLGIEVRLGR